MAEWHRTVTEEEDGQSVTLVYTSLVCDGCLTESEVEQRAKWKAGDPVDPVLLGLGPSAERRAS